MATIILRFVPPLLMVCCLGIIGLILTGTSFSDLMDFSLDPAFIPSFKTMFISIILEAFPFILLGVLFSALLQVFVSDSVIQRFTPRNPVAGVLFGSLLGLLFPLCECGMVPVVRRLIRKGMPAYIGIVYIIAGPILNPVVYTATWTAFRTRPEIAYSRMGLAFGVSVITGLILYKMIKSSPLRQASSAAVHNHDHHHGHDHSDAGAASVKSRFASTLSHASDEFFEMGKYLIFGALLTALIQTGLSRDTLAGVGEQPVLSNLFMMAFAFILSICSTSDAFIAASFTGTFSAGPLLAFLVFGPMIDLKNTLMLLSTFKTKIVITLIFLTGTLVLIGSILTERLFFP
ncbi:permease [Paenibacillus tarimensis]|uniref:permease n=1 Tax=Paenibacillus tarimensis TaxID=416012 RepID=UPI001F1EBA15|nr:permease [Paenibacillus tarimensis]MCF2943743.1 permease [Paenibacillus tarimensis]